MLLNIQPIKINNLEIKIRDNKYLMFVNEQQYMAFDVIHEHEKHEITSHIDFAYGDVITTGLGFGIRERYILEKENVKSLTVLEISSDVIEFHRLQNEEWFNNPKLTIVNIDALEYKGSCDCLLIDHYEDPYTNAKTHAWLQQAQVIQNNISSNITWIWPLEMMIAVAVGNKHELYNNIKKDYKLNLPVITPIKLDVLISNFSKSSIDQ